MINVHNSLTGAKEPLEPLEPNQISMYVCGMTVYDLCHIGHARAMVVFDHMFSRVTTLAYPLGIG